VSSFEEEAMTPGLPLEFDPTDYGGRDSEEDLIAATMGTAGSTPPPPGTDEGGGVGGGDENKFFTGAAEAFGPHHPWSDLGARERASIGTMA